MGKGFFLKEMFYVIFYVFKFKDVIFLKNWLKQSMERVHFTKHKKFIYFLRIFLKNLFPIFEVYFNVKGFYLDLRGKVSVAGNSKKRHVSILLNNYGYSHHFYKTEYTKGIV